MRLLTAFPAASERVPGRRESSLLGLVDRLTMIIPSIKASVPIERWMPLAISRQWRNAVGEAIIAMEM
jgi:hypothetical protein